MRWGELRYCLFMNSTRNTATKTNAFGRPIGKPAMSAADERMAREYTRKVFESIAQKQRA